MSGETAPGRSRAALGIGAALGALAAVPAVVRVASSGVSAGVALLALAGGGALLLGPLLALFVRAEASHGRLAFTVAGVALAAWPVARFGSLLEATTHHRPLGAATFAVGSLAAVLACLLVAHRVARLDPRGPGRPIGYGLFAAAAASTGLVLLTGLRTAALRPHVLDALLLVVAGALGWVALRRPALVRSLSRVGLLLWTVLIAAHLATATWPVFDQIRDHAPVFSGPLGWL